MIELRNNQKLLSIRRKSVTALCRFVLQKLKLGKCTLSISFVGDDEMTALNHQYFGKKRTTDVFSFPMENDIHDGILLGDVVLCVPQAMRSANENKLPVAEELSLYLIHGILHLIGERDETTAWRRRMEKKQNALLKEARNARQLLSIA